MSRIKSKNTLPERLLGAELHKRGIRYRKHIDVIGKPDIGIKKYKIAIFVDGDFWHGNSWRLKEYKSIETDLRKLPVFWRKKIRRNIKRDEYVNKELRKMKWKVIRVWESDIYSNINKYANKICKIIKRMKTF
jgi:DNA mismatch endonuclease (patch repair protein)